MKVLGRDKFIKFSWKYVKVKNVFEVWFLEVSEVDWKIFYDIKNWYWSVDFLVDNKVIFNIKGNYYRLVVRVRY